MAEGVLEADIRTQIANLESIVSSLPMPAPAALRPTIMQFADQLQGLLYLIRTESLDMTVEEITRLEWGQAALRAALSSD